MPYMRTYIHMYTHAFVLIYVCMYMLLSLPELVVVVSFGAGDDISAWVPDW